MLGPDQPALNSYLLRGQLALEIELHWLFSPFHSGNFGGAVHDPLQVLCEIVAELHDRRGRIAIPGFYDRVLDWSETERRYLASTGPSGSRDSLRNRRAHPWGEKGYSSLTNASRCVPRLR